MKKIITVSISMLCLIFTQTAYAGSFIKRTINHIQMPSTGTAIYIQLDSEIGFQGCEQTKTLLLRNNDTLPNFDEMFALLMVAKSTGSEIAVLVGNSAYGECSSNLTVVVDPYIRFH